MSRPSLWSPQSTVSFSNRISDAPTSAAWTCCDAACPPPSTSWIVCSSPGVFLNRVQIVRRQPLAYRCIDQLHLLCLAPFRGESLKKMFFSDGVAGLVEKVFSGGKILFIWSFRLQCFSIISLSLIVCRYSTCVCKSVPNYIHTNTCVCVWFVHEDIFWLCVCKKDVTGKRKNWWRI